MFVLWVQYGMKSVLRINRKMAKNRSFGCHVWPYKTGSASYISQKPLTLLALTVCYAEIKFMMPEVCFEAEAVGPLSA